MLSRVVPVVLLVSGAAIPAAAQFDPGAGQWGKDEATDVRVMTYNVRDGICRTNRLKGRSFGNWGALVRTVAALRPDVLILQETGDNSGNGSGGGVDSVPQLEVVMDLFFNGGTDPFATDPATGDPLEVTQFVGAFAPGYSLDHVFVSASDDGFNRNIIVSRWPFLDVNGDNRATTSSFSTVNGSSGIRGIQFAEIDLPNDLYRGNLIVSNAHLKSGGSSSDRSQRLSAATGLATYLWNLYNGAGTASVDPFNRVNDLPAASAVLDPDSAIIWGGDYNEDELTNGRDGPVQVSIANTPQGGGSGTDADGSIAATDSAVDAFTGSRATLSSSKLDWIMYQDSIAQIRNEFVFNSANVPVAFMPPELVGFGPTQFNLSGNTVTGTASDHRPVIVDFILPLGESDLGPGEFALLSPADGEIGVPAFQTFTWEAAADADTYTIQIANDPAFDDVFFELDQLPTTQAFVFGLGECRPYYWRVEAVNNFGSQISEVSSFAGSSPADQNLDGRLDGADFNAWLANFSAQNLLADVNEDGVLDGADFNAWLAAFSAGCGV